MLNMYAQEIEQLEAQAANLKRAAEAIEESIAKAETQLRKLKPKGKRE